MHRLYLIAVSLTLLAGDMPASAQAQAPRPSAVIAEIHAVGSQHYDGAQVIAALGMKPGDNVTRDDLQSVADRLTALGIFSSVNYKFTSRGDKIAVEFDLEDAPTVPVSFDNFPWFTDDELSAAIRQVEPFFNGNGPQQGSILDDMGAAIAKLLPARHVTGQIEHTLIAPASGDGMILQFRIEGPSLSVGSIEYGDALAQNSEHLRDRNSDLLGKPFSRLSLEIFENEQVRPLYLAAGHLRARFDAPQARFTGDPNQPLSSQVLAVLPIEAGPAFHFAGVAFSGPTPDDTATLAKLLPVQPGDLADGIKLADAWHKVEDEYARRGYLDVKVDPQPRFDDSAGTVSYQVTITPGSQYHMGELVITGLSVLAERVLRAIWRLAPGDILDRTYVDEMVVKLEKPTTAMFGELPVHYSQMGHWVRTNPQAHTADVLLDFQ